MEIEREFNAIGKPGKIRRITAKTGRLGISIPFRCGETTYWLNAYQSERTGWKLVEEVQSALGWNPEQCKRHAFQPDPDKPVDLVIHEGTYEGTKRRQVAYIFGQIAEDNLEVLEALEAQGF